MVNFTILQVVLFDPAGLHQARGLLRHPDDLRQLCRLLGPYHRRRHGRLEDRPCHRRYHSAHAAASRASAAFVDSPTTARWPSSPPPTA